LGNSLFLSTIESQVSHEYVWMFAIHCIPVYTVIDQLMSYWYHEYSRGFDIINSFSVSVD